MEEYNVCDIVYVITFETPRKAGDINKDEVTKYTVEEHVIIEKIIRETVSGLDFGKANHNYFVQGSRKNKVIKYILNDSDEEWDSKEFYNSKEVAIEKIKSTFVPISNLVIGTDGKSINSR